MWIRGSRSRFLLHCRNQHTKADSRSSRLYFRKEWTDLGSIMQMGKARKKIGPSEVAGLLKQLEKQKKYDQAEQLFNLAVEKKVAGKLTYCQMAVIYGSAQTPEKAFNLEEIMIKNNIVPDTLWLNSLLNVCVKMGSVQRAKKVFSKFKELAVLPDSSTYSQLISAAANTLAANLKTHKAKKLKSSQLNAVLREAIGWFATSKSLGYLESRKDSEFHYQHIIRACVHAGDLESAENYLLEFFAVLESFGVAIRDTPSASYFPLLYAYARSEEFEKLEKLKSMGLKVDLFICNTLLSAYARRLMLEPVDKLMDEMCKSGVKPDLVSWNSCIYAAARIGSFERAMDYYTELTRAHLQPDGTTFVRLAQAALYSGEPERSKGLLQLMVSANFEPTSNVLTTLIQNCSDMQDGHEVALYFLTKQGVDADLHMFNAAIYVMAVSDNPMRAFVLFKRMKKARIKPDLGTFNGLLQACIPKGNINLAYKILDEIVRREFEVKATTVLLLNQIAEVTMQVDEMGAKMEELFDEESLLAVAPSARYYINGKQKVALDGEGGDKMEQAVENLVSSTDYHVVLPPQAELVDHSSLASHAEKRALLEILENESDSYPVRMQTNRGLCPDCVEFFRHTAIMRNRHIFVHEPGGIRMFRGT